MSEAVVQDFFNARDLEAWQDDSPTPLYHKIYSLMKDRILDGSIGYRAQLPTEQQLAALFDVSRITAKRAMDELAAEKLVERRRGKGSYVVYQYIPAPVQAPLVGKLEKLAATGEETQLKVLNVEKVVPPADIRAELNLDRGEQAHCLTRLQLNDADEPYAYYISWTAGVRKGYSRHELETRIRQHILRENGLDVVKVEQYLGAQSASIEVARMLDMVAGDPVLTLLCHSFTEDGTLVDILFGQFNPQRYQYHLSLGVDPA